jgi:hypothetical protein
MEGFLLVGAAALVALGIPLWAIIDASRRPEESFRQIGSDKSRWILLLVLLTILFNVGGIVAAGVYLATVRPKLASIGPRSPAPPLLLDPSRDASASTTSSCDSTAPSGHTPSANLPRSSGTSRPCRRKAHEAGWGTSTPLHRPAQ